MRLHRPLVAVGGLCLTAALLPLTVAPAGATSAAASVSSVAWGTCADPFYANDLGLQCATISVPLDHANPGGEQISLAVTRRQHTAPDADYQGVMLINPGGPGGSGTVMPIISFFLPDDVAAAYDWIGWDPRGVGESTPRLSCDPSYLDPVRPPYVPTTRAIERTWLNRAQGYAADCAANNGALLRHDTTLDSVADMESMRVALGQDTINYYGYSYGTYLGQVYASRHPDRVRRMILDSNVAASTVWEQANLDQNVAFEKVFQVWYGWLATYDDVYHLGRTARQVERKVLSTEAALAQHPAGQLGASEFVDALLGAGYVQFLWPELGTALSALVNDGDPAPLLSEYAYGDDNGYAGYLAVECTDARWSHDWSVWRQENKVSYRKAPFATWGNAWFNAPCASWPAPSHRPARVGSTQTPPILLIDQTLDGATPFAGSLEARRLFPSARLIAVEGGTSHATTPDGNPCVDDQISAYLRDGTIVARAHARNKADTTCAALPQPVPDQLLATPAAARSSVTRTMMRARLGATLSAAARAS